MTKGRAVPESVTTPRLILRRWSPSDAPQLAPLLDANGAHLGDWIPRHVSTPAPVAELERRLSGFAEDFRTGRSFRFAMRRRDDGRLLGEVDLFSRAASGRVTLDDGDHAEIGYWLDAGATGQGFATEAAASLVDVARSLGGMSHVEIRCDAQNAASAAIPKRLGFALADVVDGLQIWRLDL
jgi:RimJ/RimL family protein N-acetyltransferase